MRSLFAILSMLLLVGCTRPSAAPTAKPAQKPLPLRTATVTSQDHPFDGAELDLINPKVKREVDSRRLKTLKSKRQLIESYLAAVDKSVMPLLSQSNIPNTVRHDWKKDIESYSKERHSFQGYSGRLWHEEHKNYFVRVYLQCNIRCDDGLIHTPSAPSVWIRKPARDLRFDWHINTNHKELDKKIKSIVVAEAMKF